MTSTDRMLLEQIAIKLYEQDLAADGIRTTAWDALPRKVREIYRRRAGDMAKEIDV